MAEKSINTTLLKHIPQVDILIQHLESRPLRAKFADRLVEGEIPRALLKKAARLVADDVRQDILAGRLTETKDLDMPALVARGEQVVGQLLLPAFRNVFNGTGVIIHTNMGRSLLPKSALQALDHVGAGYSNLEFDLETGKRGSRYSLVEGLLCELTGAEAALVVNNNAAAVLLALETVAAGREVVVSRGQLVEIGGSFRIPDIMAKSGARMIEVGATNRTHQRDYQQAINESTALLLKVHTSNFKISGFTSEVNLEAMVALAREHGLMVMEDLGSGCLIDLSLYGVKKEPTVREVVQTGADIVTFSGDKLLGGPQAGIIVGKAGVIEKIKRNPMNRALRIDKFTLAGLESILRLYLDEALAIRTIPTLAMITEPADEVKKKARRLASRLKKSEVNIPCTVLSTNSRIGGGAMPDQNLPSWALAFASEKLSVNDLETALRRQPVPVIGRIEEERFLLDMRTIAADDIPRLADILIGFFRSLP